MAGRCDISQIYRPYCCRGPGKILSNTISNFKNESHISYSAPDLTINRKMKSDTGTGPITLLVKDIGEIANIVDHYDN